MEQLTAHRGSWTGTCGFRMMPTDEFHEAPATMDVSPGAGGSLALVTYGWVHPEHGPCEGLLAIGPGEEHGSATALWGDSFHQQPSPAIQTGTIEGGVLTLGYEYAGGWGWVTTLDASAPDVLVLRMDNVVPASFVEDPADAGPYPVMVAELRRTDASG